MINCLRKGTISSLGAISFSIAMLLLAGCATYNDENFTAAESALNGKPIVNSNTFSIGETVGVSFSGIDPAPPVYDERIREDGTITMPLIGIVHAADKTPGALQKELQERYQQYYKNVTITVKDLERYYSVDGEVRGPGTKLYLGQTDIVNAIAAAGGFTDFAKKTKIKLIRNKKTQIINWVKAVNDSSYNVEIFPGDRIIVPRRLW